MNKVKKFRMLGVIAIFAISATTFVFRAQATVQPNNFQIVPETCKDANGNPTGLGNTCVPVEDKNCIGNPCGGSTN